MLKLVVAFAFAATLASAAPIELRDTTGTRHRPLEVEPGAKTVLVFLMPDCPVANATAPALARLANEYGKRGVRFLGIYVADDEKQVATHRREYNLPFPCILDSECRIARKVGATRVPEAAILGNGASVLYLGRIDDRAVKRGVTRPNATQHDLRNALDAVLSGRMPASQAIPGIGCLLPIRD
jgi:peroxiredoxin